MQVVFRCCQFGGEPALASPRQRREGVLLSALVPEGGCGPLGALCHMPLVVLG